MIERRNAYESIEHYLDKSKAHYLKWVFSPVNLTLACHACNFEKSTRDLGDPAIVASNSLSSQAGAFSWLHPYFDDFHENILIEKGWIYKVREGAPKEAQARQMVLQLKLDQIQTIEAHAQSIIEVRARLIELSTRCIQRGNNTRALRLLARLGELNEDGWAG